jgi:tetratricopeptide (TPR) repeat protein
VAEILEQQVGVPAVELLAYHFGRSGEQQKALRYLELAGDRAREQAALDAAAGYYRDVVARLDALGRTADVVRVREKLGDVLAAAMQTGAALEVLEQAAAALRRRGDVESLGRVLARIGWTYYLRATVADCEAGIACLQPVLAALEARGPSQSLAAVYRALSAIHSNLGTFDQGLAAAERAAAVARALDDDSLLAEAELWRGYALTQLGQVAAGLAVMEECGKLAEAVGNVTIQCYVQWATAAFYEQRGEFARARQAAGHGLTIGERLADSHAILHSTIRLGAVAFFDGHWAQARRYFERLNTPTDRNSDWTRGAQLLELGRLCMAEGAWEQATRHLEDCTSFTRDCGDLIMVRLAQSYLAERDLLQGRPEMALARLAPLLDRAGVQEDVVTRHVLPVLAWTHLESGQTDEAARVIADAIRRAREGTYRLTLVGALRVQALVALRQGTVQSAVDALEEGLQLARAMPYPHGEGRLLEVYGRLQMAHGHLEAARERLVAALAIFRQLGAHKDVERTEQMLAALG